MIQYFYPPGDLDDIPELIRPRVGTAYAAALRAALERRFPGRPVAVGPSATAERRVRLDRAGDLAPVLGAIADVQDDDDFWAAALVDS